MYESQDGYLHYYADHYGHHKTSCDPTMMFLLGLNAVISSDSNEDFISFPNTLDRYSSIKKYLTSSAFSCTEDDTSIRCNCSELKSVIRTLTGNDLSKSVPLIYRNDHHVAAPCSDASIIIHNIFSDAECSANDTALKYLTKEEKLAKIKNSKSYKCVSYAAMYLYSLGVLYGCVCLGYDETLVFNTDPLNWYIGDLQSLISSAYDTFKFRNKPLNKIDTDPNLTKLYKGIQSNRIWNLSDSTIGQIPDGYTIKSMYDLSTAVSIILNDADPTKMLYHGTDIPIVEFGYSETPSSRLDAYTHDLQPYDLRHNDIEGYWSRDWDPKLWKDSIDDIYIKDGLVSLYRADKLITKADQYYYVNDGSRYIYSGSFKNIDTDMYSQGITTYPCTPIIEDDYGNSLIGSDGKTLVWYDQSTHLYWNGLYDTNLWQQDKPVAYGKSIYDVFNRNIILGFNDVDNSRVGLNSGFISYSDFYTGQYGFIDDTLMVYDLNSDNIVLECYYDSGKDIYCIPDITSVWMSRSEISALGYTFVDGISNLYLGDSELSLVYDNDTTD